MPAWHGCLGAVPPFLGPELSKENGSESLLLEHGRGTQLDGHWGIERVCRQGGCGRSSWECRGCPVQPRVGSTWALGHSVPVRTSGKSWVGLWHVCGLLCL